MTRVSAHHAGLTYSREWHESLDQKAGSWGELVGFLNQDIKAHLGEEEQQKKYMVLQWPERARAECEGALYPWLPGPQHPMMYDISSTFCVPLAPDCSFLPAWTLRGGIQGLK